MLPRAGTHVLGAERRARPSLAGVRRGRTEGPATVDDVARALLVGEPGGRVRLVDPGLAPIADAAREGLSQPDPLRVAEHDRVVVRGLQRPERALLVVVLDSLAGDRARGAVARLDVLLVAQLTDPGHVPGLGVSEDRAAVLDVRGAVADDLRRERGAAAVLLHGGQPAVHGDQRVGREAVVALRLGVEPDDLVSEVALLALEPRADGPRSEGVVERAVVGAADIDDRHLIEVARRVDGATPVGVAQRRPVGAQALRAGLAVDVDATDLRVQVDELRGCDLASLQGLEAVLDPD